MCANEITNAPSNRLNYSVYLYARYPNLPLFLSCVACLGETFLNDKRFRVRVQNEVGGFFC